MSLAALLAAFGILVMPVRAVDVNLDLPYPVMIEVEAAQALETPPEKTIWTETALQALVSSTTKKYALNEAHFDKVINCESQWTPEAIGDHGDSIGIAQINLPAHPEITKEEALDPQFSIDWMAKRWAEGEASLWSCWRRYYE